MRQDERQHEKHKEIQIGEEAVIAAFLCHISCGVDVDQKADSGYDQ